MLRRPTCTMPLHFRKLPQTSKCQRAGIEVGHIFYFGTKYSEPMKAVVATHDGKEVPVHMGFLRHWAEPTCRRNHRSFP